MRVCVHVRARVYISKREQRGSCNRKGWEGGREGKEPEREREGGGRTLTFASACLKSSTTRTDIFEEAEELEDVIRLMRGPLLFRRF